jgi:hypothetical protein
MFLNEELKKIGETIISLDVMDQKETMRYEYDDEVGDVEFDENAMIKHSSIKNISCFYYSTHTNGYTKILTFDDSERVNEEKETEDHTPELMINIELGGLGISIIHDVGEGSDIVRKEISFCNLNLIECMLIDFKTQRKIQLKIGRMQMDNQYEYDTPFPVILFSKNLKLIEKDTIVKPFFNLNMIMSRNIPDVLYFK